MIDNEHTERYNFSFEKTKPELWSSESLVAFCFFGSMDYNFILNCAYLFTNYNLLNLKPASVQYSCVE